MAMFDFCIVNINRISPAAQKEQNNFSQKRF